MKRLSSSQVLARMKKGDLPTVSGAGQTITFEDGARVSPKVMHDLVLRGLVDKPKHGSIYSPYTLCK